MFNSCRRGVNNHCKVDAHVLLLSHCCFTVMCLKLFVTLLFSNTIHNFLYCSKFSVIACFASVDIYIYFFNCCWTTTVAVLIENNIRF